MNKQKAKKKIPKGCYCYKETKPYQLKRCPFWSIKANLPEQENGYCSYLGKSDYDLNEERGEMKWYKGSDRIKLAYTTKPHEIPNSLLWDSCKECGVKLND